MKRILVFTGLILSVLGVCGDKVGSGGHVVDCTNSPLKLGIELLDFFEARAIYKLNYNLGNSYESIQAKIDVALERLSKVDQYRAKVYKLMADDFLHRYIVQDEKDITFVSDHLFTALPTGCRLRQFAVQVNFAFPVKTEFWVNRDLWERLDHDNRAGLILHEVIYQEAIIRGHTNSKRARRFVAYIASEKILEFSETTYLHFLKEIGFPAR